MPAAEQSNIRKIYALVLLTLVASVSLMDRTVMVILQESIRHEFHLSDSQIGLMNGLVFSVAYAAVTLPFGVLADRVERSRLLAVCLAFWSATTAVCGLAGNFLQLLAARLAVGAGEAAGHPATVSMVSDLFPAKRRGTALAVYYLSVPIGAGAALVGGGLIAGAYGWRTAFVAAAIPGFLLALLLAFTLRAPPRRTAQGATAKPPPLREVLAFVLTQRALVQMIIAMTISALAAAAVGAWAASFFLRYHDMSVREVGLVLGPLNAVAGVVGMLASGLIADRIGRRDPRRALWLIAGAMALHSPALVIAFTMHEQSFILAGFGLYLAIHYLSIPAALAATQNLAGAARRSTVAALVVMSTTLLGSGLGPLVTGVASDLLKPYAGAESLRWAMLGVSLLGFWSALHVLAALRTYREDLVRAEAS
ncbi:MFS transporter [Phenylobacterium sp.]|uniref:MFS transporter n=1 Tax=Phenylobacterium sp. TaxID=1871053 RepID=UPI002F4129AA